MNSKIWRASPGAAEDAALRRRPHHYQRPILPGETNTRTMGEKLDHPP
jgi:hypothetical protein